MGLGAEVGLVDLFINVGLAMNGMPAVDWWGLMISMAESIIGGLLMGFAEASRRLPTVRRSRLGFGDSIVVPEELTVGVTVTEMKRVGMIGKYEFG